MKKTIPIIALTALLAACGNSTEEKANGSDSTTAKRVETAQVKAVDYIETVFASGKLASKEEVKLSFKTGGIIKRVYVSEGQSVKKGQLLADLNMDEVLAQTHQAELGRQQAEITIKNAELAVQLADRDYRNALGLYQDSVATLEQLENAEVQLNNTRNQLDAAKKGLSFNKQNVDVANFNLKYSKIVAPANGTILKKLAEANEMIGPGAPVFLFGSKDKSLVIKVNMTDKDIIHIKLNDEARVSFDAYPRQAFKGVVREVASMADPYTGTYEVEVEVFSEGKKLLSGFIGAVHIFTGSERQLLEVPVDALIGANENKGEVFVVENGKALKTQILIFKIQGENLLVNRGLNEDDLVVISGVGYLEHEDSVIASK